ncbi:NADH-quinone oxidoreductase subunit M [Streptomyces sp. SPB162]|nr:NADH-quinone oxidoreductase subunit M [Streptomyces sp. SPB162]
MSATSSPSPTAWIKDFGVRYELGVDGIGVSLVALTALLIPFVIAAGWHDADPLEDKNPNRRWRPTQGFFALILAVEAMVVVSFEATDVFLFYIFFEAMLIPMYFLIGGFGDQAHAAQSSDSVAGGDDEAARQRSYAAVKFLLYNLVGGLVMLAAVIGLYAASADQLGHGTFSLQEILRARADGKFDLGSSTERWLFLGFFFAFAVKAPLWPLHTWLPNAMGESTAPVAVLITAVVDKVGTFAMLRYCLQLFPEASKWATPAILVLAVISIIYGALLAVGQRDIKRLIAYASISHFGFIILGIFAMTTQGQSGAALYMVNHGISTAALLLVAGFLISRRGSRLIADYGGVQKVAPVLAGTFLIGGLATLSLPGLAPFVSEFLVLVGTFSRYPAIGIIATVGIVLAALYVLVLYQRTMTGPVKAGIEGMRDLRVREIAVVAPLIALLLFLGVYPKPLTDIVNPAVGQTLSDVHKTDPKPALEATK